MKDLVPPPRRRRGSRDRKQWKQPKRKLFGHNLSIKIPIHQRPQNNHHHHQQQPPHMMNDQGPPMGGFHGHIPLQHITVTPATPEREGIFSPQSSFGRQNGGHAFPHKDLSSTPENEPLVMPSAPLITPMPPNRESLFSPGPPPNTVTFHNNGEQRAMYQPDPTRLHPNDEHLTVVSPQVPISPLPSASFQSPMFNAEMERDFNELQSNPEELHSVAHAFIQDGQYHLAAQALRENIESWKHIGSLISLGCLYERQLIESPEHPPLKMALWHYSRAFELSGRRNVMAMHNIGNVFRALGRPDRSFEWYSRAVNAGDVASLTSIGCLYDAGFLSEQEHTLPEANMDRLNFCLKRAASYYLAASLRGHIDAKLNLGQMYEFGRGLKRDELEARRLFQQVLQDPAASPDAVTIAQDYLKRVNDKIFTQTCMYA